MNERWRDTYDAWKTHNPADDGLGNGDEDEEPPEDEDCLDEDWIGWEIEP